jgi:hypothetical protein
MAGAGFEPAKAEPTRLQRVPFDRSGTPPGAGQFRAFASPARIAGEGLLLLSREAPVTGGAPGRLGGLAQVLRFGQRLELFQRPVLDLANALAGDVEGATDLLQRA